MIRYGFATLLVLASSSAFAGKHEVVVRHFGITKQFNDPLPTHVTVEKVSPDEGIILEVQQDLTLVAHHNARIENLSTESSNTFEFTNTDTRISFLNPQTNQSMISEYIDFGDHTVEIKSTYDGITDFQGDSSGYFSEDERRYTCAYDYPDTNPSLMALLTGDGSVNIPIEQVSHYEYSDSTGNNIVLPYLGVSFRWVMKVTILQF